MIKRVGIVGSGIMGSGIAEVAAKAGIEVDPPVAPAGDGRRHGRRRSRSRSPSRSSGASSSEDERDAGPRPGHRHRRPPRPGRLRPRDRVGRRGPRHQEGAVHASSTTSCKDDAILATNTSTLPVVELAMVTERPEQGLRHPLLQPGADDVPGRGRPPAHRQRRDDRRRPRRSPRRAARRRSRSRTAPASSSTRCCSRTSTTRCACSRTARPAATTSTRR